jgi:hypothetical protein
MATGKELLTKIENAQEVLTADRTYYVNSTTGSDTNDGLTVGSPFATVQHAVDTAQRINNAGYTITFQLADGNYGPLTISGAFTGGGALVIKGNDSDSTAVVFNAQTATKYGNVAVAIDAIPNFVIIESIKFASVATALVVGSNSYVIVRDLVFDTISGFLLWGYSGGTILAQATILTFKGSNGTALLGHLFGAIEIIQSTIVLDSTPSFSAFVNSQLLGSVRVQGSTITGTATGKRYSAKYNSIIFTAAGETFLPGDVAGTADAGGLYV